MNNDDECHIRSALQKTAHCSLLRNYMPPATLLYNGTADLQTQDPRQGRSNHDSFCDLFICVTQILNVTFFHFYFLEFKGLFKDLCLCKTNFRIKYEAIRAKNF